MAGSRLNVSAADLQARIRIRLLNGANPASAVVAWQDGDAEVLVYVGSLALRLTQGWLVVSVDLESKETGRGTLRVPFFLGRAERGAGLHASCGQDPGNHPALAGRWGGVLQTAIWNGVLDVLEGAFAFAQKRAPGLDLTLLSFSAGEGTVTLDVES
ncbi:MAG TPA: hypothetical protein VLX28_10735 [Thermoanaerobaculia bacterium]|nr:hypothetical protein [Thermoanaerobaculia bacterium]